MGNPYRTGRLTALERYSCSDDKSKSLEDGRNIFKSSKMTITICGKVGQKTTQEDWDTFSVDLGLFL